MTHNRRSNDRRFFFEASLGKKVTYECNHRTAAGPS